MLRIQDLPEKEKDEVDELAREGARRMTKALETEVAEYIEPHQKLGMRRATRWWCAMGARGNDL